MMKLFFFAATLFLAIKSFSGECSNIQLQPVSNGYSFTSSAAVNPSIVVKANTNPGPCDFFITVAYGGGGSSTNRRLANGVNTWPVRITKDSAGANNLKTLAQATSTNDVVTGYLPEGGNNTQVTVNFWAELLDLYSSRPSGNYSDTFLVSLYKGTLASNTFVDSYTLTLTANSLKIVDISLVSTGGTFNAADTTETLNFGNITTGVTKSADVILKYNSGYILKASSANNSRMKHTTQNAFIPYTIKFAGTTVNLTNSAATPVTINSGTGVSPANGTIFSTVITIGTVPANQTSGAYADTITLTVQSN